MAEDGDIFFQEQKDWSKRKLSLVQQYLAGFTKILGSSTSQPCVYYVDGFAGKGIYDDGAKGSPVLATELAQDLEIASEVCVYAKLPDDFDIPTPVGNYSPGWAIAFNKDNEKHIYFIAETKGSMNSMELRTVEQAKIAYAKKLFNEISTNEVRYHEVDSYQNLLNIIGRL